MKRWSRRFLTRAILLGQTLHDNENGEPHHVYSILQLSRSQHHWCHHPPFLWEIYTVGLNLMDALRFTEWGIERTNQPALVGISFWVITTLEGHIDHYELSTPLTTKIFANYQNGELYGIDHGNRDVGERLYEKGERDESK